MSIRDIPVVEMQVRAMGEKFHGMIALHQQEIQSHIEAGFKRAANEAADTIVQAAAEEASKAFTSAVRSYFSYGPGRDAINAAVAHAMEPVLSALKAD